MWRIPGSDGSGPPQPEWVTEQARFAPAALDWRIVLIDTSDVVCCLLDVRVFPSSCRFRVRSVLRPSATPRAREVFNGPHRFGHEPIAAADLETSFLLGVEYEDGGRSALGIDTHRPQPFEHSSPAPHLLLRGSSRNPDFGDADVVLSGLPQKGPITFHARWTALGAAESTRELDGAALRAAADRAVELWPPDGVSSPAS